VQNLYDFILKRRRFLCTNDNRSDTFDVSVTIIDAIVSKFYEVMFPYPSSFEKNGYCLNFSYFDEYLRERYKLQTFIKAIRPIVKENESYLRNNYYNYEYVFGTT